MRLVFPGNSVLLASIVVGPICVIVGAMFGAMNTLPAPWLVSSDLLAGSVFALFVAAIIGFIIAVVPISVMTLLVGWMAAIVPLLRDLTVWLAAGAVVVMVPAMIAGVPGLYVAALAISAALSAAIVHHGCNWVDRDLAHSTPI